MSELASSYPHADISVLPLDQAFAAAYPAPGTKLVQQWPPIQVEYLRVYLKEIGCKTVVIEHHYVDRVFMHDEAVFYVRNLRSYPNYTKRLHFFTDEFDLERWRAMVVKAKGDHTAVQGYLQEHYRGFSVVRPLADSPVGRTLLPAQAPHAPAGTHSTFPTVRHHTAHLSGFRLIIDGVPFQQQDQGVSACATTALWSALDSVASIEEIPGASPATITEAATRYPLQEGRPFPTEGLTIRQICEATRAAGFSPVVIRGTDLASDRLQIYSYLQSGLSPVLGLISTKDGMPGHAVCGVGLRTADIMPRTNMSLSFQDAATSLRGLYIHDDRLGPYAYAELSSFTDRRTTAVRTRVAIEWPDKTPDEEWLLHAIVVPVPQKLRLTATRIRRVGLFAAQVIGEALSEPATVLNCRYDLSRRYVAKAYGFGLSDDAIFALACQTPLSRLVGIIEIGGPAGPVIDLLLDTTEANPEPAIIACLMRPGLGAKDELVRALARYFGAKAIV